MNLGRVRGSGPFPSLMTTPGAKLEHTPQAGAASGSPETPARPDDAESRAPPTPSVAWHRSFSFRGIVGLLLLLSALWTATYLVLQVQGKPLVRVETERLIEQMGNNAVAGLMVRAHEIAALSRTLGVTAAQLPKEVAIIKATLPALIDFAGDRAVAGGGFWPEPGRFDAGVERRSFFWGRDAQHRLQYFDDYNQPGPGYHQEEWYVPSPYMRDGACYWSQSYMDPYSYQPMVTCTVAIKEDGQFAGVSTIDLRLEGLSAFAEEWRKKTGGYVFILDRNNRFITYPKSSEVKRFGTDDKGNRTEEFVTANEFSAKQPLFAPFAKVLTELNDEVISSAEDELGARLVEIAGAIDRDSYQIDAEQSRLIAAITSDPLRTRLSIESSTLYRSFELPDDAVLGAPALAFVFSVPSSYWKLVVVKPIAEATAVADSIAHSLALFLLPTALLIVGIAYFVLNRTLIHPLELAARVMHRIGTLISERRYLELSEHRISASSRNEIGELGKSFNHLVDRVVDNEAQLAQAQQQLIGTSRRAGMAEVATNVLHNVGNVLNSVNVSATLVAEKVKDARPARLAQAVALLRANDANLGEYLSRDPKGSHIPAFLEQVAAEGLRHQQMVIKELDLLRANIDHIKQIVAMQQSYAKVLGSTEIIDLRDLVEDSIGINAGSLVLHQIRVVREFEPVPPISVDRHKVLQIMVNLVRNARQACNDLVDTPKTITLRIAAVDGRVQVSVGDNGCGIATKDLTRIFAHGFTTRQEGHGYGLNSGALAAAELGGSLTAYSEGLGKGATFILDLPLNVAGAKS